MKSDDAEANHKEVRNESIKLIRSTESSDSENTSSKSKSVWESQAVWRGVVVVLCILWASNYPVIKLLYDEVPSLDPQLFLAVRFSVASLFFIPSIVRSFKNTSFLLAATLMCVFIVPGHFGQAQGLVVSSADKGAFINSLGVVWVAFLDAIITRRIKLQTWIAGLMAVIGSLCTIISVCAVTRFGTFPQEQHCWSYKAVVHLVWEICGTSYSR